MGGVIVEYFLDLLTEEDARRFNQVLGSSRGQQTWEALALLVSLRLWRSWWCSSRFRVIVHSDSVTALYLLVNGTTRSEVNVAIAREVSLELGSGLYSPDEAVHIPGVTNVIPDALSRLGEDSARPLPAALANAKQIEVPARVASWYLAAVPPRRERRMRA